jgi:hypothetical protein
MSIPEPIDVVFSFDTTGSMRSCIGQVRRKVEIVIKQLFNNIPGLHIGFISHGDYCDGADVITIQDLTDNQALLCDFVKTAPDTYGGDEPECYELVLHKARSFNWRAGKSKVLVVIGDATPHGPTYPDNTLNLDWRNELKLLLEAGIHVYSVQCLARRYATPFYKEMAEMTGGFHLDLHQFAAIVDIIMAVCYKQESPEALTTFEKQVEESGRMTDVTGSCFDIMAGRPKRTVRSSGSGWRSSSTAKKLGTLVSGGTVDVSKLEPVHPSRFQVLNIDRDCPIKEFVADHRLTFKTGRGFYEFVKSVVVQPYKEVVLVDKETGAMFSGDDARTMIGLPAMNTGGNVKLRPGVLPGFTAYIQSTSHNRKLLAGTEFLYEVDDWDATSEASA